MIGPYWEVCDDRNGALGSVRHVYELVQQVVDGVIRAGWLRFDTRSRIIFKSVATGVFCTESGSDWTGNQRMEGSCESGRTLRTENQNLG